MKFQLSPDFRPAAPRARPPRFALVLLPLFIPALGACTSLARPDVQDVRIETTPPGATARVRYGPECTTPCSVTLDRENGYLVWLSKPGCKPKTVRIAPKARLDWYSVTVDHWTGDVYDLTPNPLAVDLSCRDGRAVSATRDEPRGDRSAGAG